MPAANSFGSNASEYLVRATQGASRGVPGAAQPGVLRELHRIDYRLVRGDTVPARTGDLDSKGANEAGKQFFSEFAEDCDLKGTRLTDFFRQQLVEHAGVRAELHRWWIFRGARRPAPNRAEEDATGGRGRTWWSTRRTRSSTGATTVTGNLEWVVIRTSCLRQEKVSDAEWKSETRWIYYDRENFRDLHARRADAQTSADRADRPGATRTGGAAARAGISAQGERRAVADEQGRAAAAGALQ